MIRMFLYISVLYIYFVYVFLAVHSCAHLHLHLAACLSQQSRERLSYSTVQIVVTICGRHMCNCNAPPVLLGFSDFTFNYTV